MKRHKWIVGLRNKCADFAMECDSAAAINGAEMTQSERNELRKRLRDVVYYIDSKIFD